MRDGALGESGAEEVAWGAIDARGRWIDLYTDNMIAAGLSLRTISLRRDQLRRLAGAKLHRSPWRLTTVELVAWQARQNWAAETRRSWRATLRSFYAWGVKAGHTKTNPAAALPAIRAGHTEPRPTPDEISAAALDAATDRDRLILALACYAGLRRAEIAELEWASIAGGAIRVKGKGRRVRSVPIHPVLEREILAERARRDAGGTGTGYRYTEGLQGPYLFPGLKGGPMTPNAVGKAATKALGGGWGAHSLRHQFATRALAGSGNLLVVQALLGHANVNTTIRYTKLADGALAAAVRSV